MESIQAVGFNAAINITTLSYFSTTQPPLINIAVSSVSATNHMTGTFTHSPWPGETGCRWSSACLYRHSPGHLRAGAETGNRSEPDTVVSSRNLLYSSSVINWRGSLFRNYPGMQRQPESSLWSLCSKWSAQMPRWRIPVSGSLSSLPSLGGGLMGRGGCTCHWVSTDCYRAIRTLY